MSSGPRVFLGSSSESLDVMEVLQEKLQDVAHVVPWKGSAVFPAGEFTLHSLLDAASKFDFAVMIFGRDDLVNIRGTNLQAPRDNVVFELGLFMSHLGYRRTFALCPTGIGEYRVLTDLSGLTLLTYDEQPGSVPDRSSITMHDAKLRSVYLRGALESAADTIRRAIATLKSREHGPTAKLVAMDVHQLRDKLFGLLDSIGGGRKKTRVYNLANDLGVTWPLIHHKLFHSDLRNVSWRTLVIDPDAPRIRDAAGAGIALQVARSRIEVDIPDACVEAAEELKRRHIAFACRAYSEPPAFHGFLINDQQLLLAFPVMRPDGKLDTRANPYWMYERMAHDDLSKHPITAFASWFDHLWKTSREICAVSE